MNTAELLVRCLENEGVEYIFGVPGEENLQVLQALKQSSIRFVTTRHEQGAAKDILHSFIFKAADKEFS
ncbi:MAG: thiamine pyrophosphate-binding protein, partial [Cyanobacteria bacterium J06607_6]